MKKQIYLTKLCDHILLMSLLNTLKKTLRLYFSLKLKYDHIVHKVQICTFVQLCAAVKEEEQQQQQQCMSLFSFVVVFYFILKIQQM